MVQWLKVWGTHVLGSFLVFFHFVVHGNEFLETLTRWTKQLLGIKTWIVRRIGERRKNVNIIQMLAEGPAVLGEVLGAITKLQADLPLLLKTIADFQALAADKQDPVKLMADLNAILPDITADLQAVAALFPKPQTPKS